VSTLVFVIVLGAAGAFIALVGQLLSKDWQKRAALLLGVLLLFGALMSALLDLTTSLLWGGSVQSTEEREYQPGTLVAELEAERSETLTSVALAPVASATIAAATASGTIQASVLARSTNSPESTKTPGQTTTPRPTHTLMPTETPTVTDTPTPTSVPATPTMTPTAVDSPTPEPTPTREVRPTEVPELDPLRVSRKTLDSRLRAVAVIDPNTGTQKNIFELGGHPAYNTIISAAWSPDGRQVLIAYRWATSRQDLGIVLRIVNADGTGGRDVLAMSTAGQYRALGNALWLPNGQEIVFHLVDGSNDGVWIIQADGSGLRRLDNSVPGEWPRFLSADEAWLITVAGDGSLYALALDQGQRLPMSAWGQEGIYDQRYYPWRFRRGTRCDVQEDSWWKCR
jgi:hypothetical protein